MAKKEDTHTSHMHGVSRHSHGEHAGGQTQHSRQGMHGQRRPHPTALPARARRDVWQRQGKHAS